MYPSLVSFLNIEDLLTLCGALAFNMHGEENHFTVN